MESLQLNGVQRVIFENKPAIGDGLLRSVMRHAQQPKGSCAYLVYTLGRNGFPYAYYWAQVYTLNYMDPLGRSVEPHSLVFALGHPREAPSHLPNAPRPQPPKR